MVKFSKLIYFLLGFVLIALIVKEGSVYLFKSKKEKEVASEPVKTEKVRITEAGALEKEINCNAASFQNKFPDLVYSDPLKVPDFWAKELEGKNVPVPIDIYRIKGTVSKIWEEEGKLIWELTAGDERVEIEVNRQPPKLNALAYNWPGDPQEKVKKEDRVAVLLGAICGPEQESRLVFYSYKVVNEE